MKAPRKAPEFPSLVRAVAQLADPRAVGLVLEVLDVLEQDEEQTPLPPRRVVVEVLPDDFKR